MVDTGIGDYFISDAEDDSLNDEVFTAPVVVPVSMPVPIVASHVATTTPEPLLQASAPVQQSADALPSAAQPQPQPQPPAAPQLNAVRQSTREEQLAAALDRLMQEDPDIQAAALVSLDGFTMASALPDGMQADRVGAMSAAILGLGERAAAELGRGHLSQVFIQGDSGYVLLMSVGERAVLTAMADSNAKLGLVLYDMRAVADDIAGILG
jgi:predicted regulator of Ras-like GTPase activity (Roadblock/LC7/MglB family)